MEFACRAGLETAPAERFCTRERTLTVLLGCSSQIQVMIKCHHTNMKRDPINQKYVRAVGKPALFSATGR